MRSKILVQVLSFITVLLSAVEIVHAQSTVKGKVVESNQLQEPIAGVLVTIGKDGTKTSAFVSTNARGEFTLSIPIVTGQYLLSLSKLGYEKVTIPLLVRGNESIDLKDVKLAKRSIDIKEVIVKPPSIRASKDTVVYDVDSHTRSMDRTIADVLKRLPGIDVSENGMISYQGKPINKFYIEGLNLLDGKYNLATNNLSPKDVRSIEVLENHQSIKALESTTFTDRAAINLKLQEHAKEKWLGKTDLAGGVSPGLWQVDAMAMRIRAKKQMLNVLKSNNTGLDIIEEIRSHALEELISKPDNLIDMSSYFSIVPSNPAISKHRYLLNKAVLGSSNNLQKIGEEQQLKTNVSYTRNVIDNFQQSNTVYLLPGTQSFEVIENVVGNLLDHQINAEVTLEKNVLRGFMKNSLSAQYLNRGVRSDIVGSLSNNQSSEGDALKVSHEFNWIKPLGKSALKLNAFTLYSQLPENLTIRDTQGQIIKQELNRRTFYSAFDAGMTKNIWRFSVDLIFGVALQNQLFESDAVGADSLILGQSWKNEEQWFFVKPYVMPVINYQFGKLQVKANLPLHQYLGESSDRLNETSTSFKPLFFEPNFTVRYRFGPLWTISTGYNISNVVGGVEDLATSAVLRSYRNVKVGVPTPLTRRSYRYSGDLQYRNPVNGLFVSLSQTGLQSNQNQIDNNIYQGIIQVNDRIIQPKYMTSNSTQLHFSKAFDFRDAIFKMRARYTFGQNELIQQSLALESSFANWSIVPAWSMRLFPQLFFAYETEWSRQQASINMLDFQQSFIQWKQKISLTQDVGSKIHLQFDVEHFTNETGQNNYVSDFFLDIRMRYRLGKRTELYASAINLLNTDKYMYNYVGEINTLQYQYTIRPFNFLAGIVFNW